MSLCRFSIIVAVDKNGGIAKSGYMPWNCRSDMKFFRDMTVGHKRNVVIMGRKTYETIPVEHRPLRDRECVVISRSLKQAEHPSVTVCTSLIEAFGLIGNRVKKYDEIFVAGGETIYQEVVRDFLYLCSKIYVTKFKREYDCDQFFPIDNLKEMIEAESFFQSPQKTRDFTRYFIAPKIQHQEYTYLNVLQDILDNGEKRSDRTSVGTVSKFGVRMEFDISKRLPVITTRKISYDQIIKELLFFVSGKTDTKILSSQGVKIWEANTTRKFLDSRKLEYDEGDMGTSYGFQWRHWGAEYIGADGNYTGQGIDQLQNLIDNIRNDPFSRRHILSAWNVSQLDEMALPPCHLLAQFYVSADRKFLDCQMYQRSGDCFLGVTWNITSYCILTYMIAHLTQLRPRKFIHVIGDAHIYNNHVSQVSKLIARVPKPFPILRFRKSASIHEIDDFEFNSFALEGYDSWPSISGKMAV
jgi:dihydrofolate reductase / thymidylate synthase